MTLILFYIPVASRESGLTLARSLVEESLAACGNVLGPMTSVYRWEGQICEEEEWLLLLKTLPEKEAALSRRLEELHPYSCPALIRWPAGMNAPFADWMRDQLS